MGLIKAIAGAAGGVMADQWKEYFYCEAMPANILATKGHKKVTGRSSNYKGDENIITNGSMTVSVCSRMAQRTVRCILPSYFARKARTSRLM